MMERLVNDLRGLCGTDAVLAGREETLVYDCDAYTIDKHLPQVVVLPRSTEQVSRVVQLARREGMPFVARGAGTGLSGGALARQGGVIIALTRMKRILEIDLRNRRITAEAGAVNLALTRAVSERGYQYAPDPSSQSACTIGGNVAENSGGPHTLKYGVTVNHVLGVKIVELDGLEAGLDRQAERARALCMAHGAREVRSAATTAERTALWMARKKAIGAAGRLAPSNCTQDGVIPRTKLPQVLREIAEIGRRHRLRICNVFHAGDGNLHPVLLFDERDPEEVKRVLAAGSAILQACVDAGGSITGEHGIGIEKIDHMRSIFSDTDLGVMQKVKDVFNPEGLCNP